MNLVGAQPIRYENGIESFQFSNSATLGVNLGYRLSSFQLCRYVYSQSCRGANSTSTYT
jgi:hypothetical protein